MYGCEGVENTPYWYTKIVEHYCQPQIGMNQSKNFATTAENVQHMHPLSDTLSSGMVQAVEQEIEMALAKGVKSDDPDLVALRQALCEITGSVFTSTFKDLKGRETENNEQYEEASDSDSDDNDAPTFCAEKNGISNTNTNQPVEDVVTSDKQNSNPIDEKTTEKLDSSENVHIKPGFYDSAEFEGIFEQRVVQIGIEAAPDALAREMQIIPLVHRIEIIDIVNDVFPHAKVSITSADDPVIFKRDIVLHFSNLYAPLLYKPLGTLKTRLDNKQDEFQVRIKAQLFWRCAIQVHCQVQEKAIFFTFSLFLKIVYQVFAQVKDLLHYCSMKNPYLTLLFFYHFLPFLGEFWQKRSIDHTCSALYVYADVSLYQVLYQW